MIKSKMSQEEQEDHDKRHPWKEYGVIKAELTRLKDAHRQLWDEREGRPSEALEELEIQIASISVNAKNCREETYEKLRVTSPKWHR